jgi:AraC-like DNA-binding protein
MEQTKYMAKIEKQHLKIYQQICELETTARNLRSISNYMEVLGEDQGRLLDFIISNQEQDPQYWEDTISKVCTLKTEEIAKEVGISSKRIERAFVELYKKDIIRTRFIKKYKAQKYWLNWDYIQLNIKW